MILKAADVSDKANITCNRCIIWSWISDTRGEITNVIPGQIRAGSCKEKKKQTNKKFQSVNSHNANDKKLNFPILTREPYTIQVAWSRIPLKSSL